MRKGEQRAAPQNRYEFKARNMRRVGWPPPVGSVAQDTGDTGDGHRVVAETHKHTTMRLMMVIRLLRTARGWSREGP
jgi:hypothetical protein